MKGLLTFLFVVVLGTAIFGWFKGWFSVTAQPDSEGNPSFTLHTNPDKVGADLHVALAKSKDLIAVAEAKIKELKDKSAKAKGDQKTKLDHSIADLEGKRKALQTKYDALSKTGGRQTEAEQKALAQEIDDLDKAIEQAGVHK